MSPAASGGPPAADGRWGGLSPAGWALLLVGLHLLLGLLLYEPTLFPGGDNAGYMILGQSLRTGHGYRDLYLPGAPLHTKYPPLYPALLAILGLTGGGLQLFKLASLALTTASVWLAWRLGRALGGSAAGLAAAGLLAVSPALLEFSHVVLSEAPFTFFVVLSLVGCAEERPLVSVAAAAGAFLTRTAGLPLLVAVPVGFAVRGERRRAVASGILFACLLGGWALFQRLGTPGEAGYLSQLTMVNPYDPGAGHVGAAGLLSRVAGNLWTYVSASLPHALTDVRPGPDGSFPLLLLGLVVTALAFADWLGRMAAGIRTSELFALLYVGLLAVWPSVWTDRRFLLPLLPLLFVYVVGGVARLAQRVRSEAAGMKPAGRKRRGRAAPAIALAALLLALPGALADGHEVPERAECLQSWRAGSPCDPPAFASFYAAARWAKSHLPPDAIVANRKPRIFYWISGLRGDVYPYSPEPEAVLRGLDEMKARFVVVDALSATTARYLVPAIQAHAKRFGLLYREGDPPTLVLSMEKSPETALR